MNLWASAIALWIADLYFLATLLLLFTRGAMRFVRQPLHRLKVAWVTFASLAFLAALCCVPIWPRFQIISVLPTEPVSEALTSSTVDVTAGRSLRSREQSPDSADHAASPTTLATNERRTTATTRSLAQKLAAIHRRLSRFHRQLTHTGIQCTCWWYRR